MTDSFELYDLRVETLPAGKGRRMICNHPPGSGFDLRGENLILRQESFPLYALAALMPLLPAMQRELHPNDWMSTDQVIACPDPYCGGRFRITRLARSRFSHSEVAASTEERKEI